MLSSRRTRPLVSTPCFMGKPCLSLPPLMRTTYPWRRGGGVKQGAPDAARHTGRGPPGARLEPLPRDTCLPLISQRVGGYLGGHTLLIESTQFAFIVHFDELLAAGCGERDVQLRGKRSKKRRNCMVIFYTLGWNV